MTTTPTGPIVKDDGPGQQDSTPVTYAELMDHARLCAARAQRNIARTALADADAARYVLASRARLLSEVARHVEVTLGAGVVQAWRHSAPARRGTDERDRRVRYALAWLDALAPSRGERGGQHRAPTPQSGRPVAGVHLDRARVLVAAASDLIATHRGPDGALRPTASPALGTADAMGLLAAPVRLAAMVAPVEPLALRCRQAGLPRATIDDALPLGDPVTVASWNLAAAMRFPDSAVAPVTAHASAVDTSSPAAEWVSRLDRIATRLRVLEARGRVSVRSLHDLATLGLVTSHVLTTSTRTGPDSTTPPVLGPVTEQWRVLAAHLAPLRSTEPVDRVIRHDVERLLSLAHPGSSTDPVARRQVVAAMRAGVATLDDCAQVASRLMRASSDAWIPATPRRPYLPDLHRPGQAAHPAPPAPTGFPRMGPTLT